MTESMIPDEIIIKPVGIIKNTIKTPERLPGDKNSSGDNLKERIKKREKRDREINETVSEIVVDKKYDGILDGIEDFSHILILYWPHMLPKERRSLIKVHPMGRKDIAEKGIFSTCSPARPNPVLITAVPLLSRDGNVLKVQGLEAVNGSPVIDIKPYSTHYYSPDNVKIPDWMNDLA